MSKMVGGNVGGREFPPVVIYSGNDCVWCVRAKEYMTEHGVAYTEKNVEENDDYAAEALALVSRRGVPIIVIGSEVVQGFNKPAIDALLGFGATAVQGDGIEIC